MDSNKLDFNIAGSSWDKEIYIKKDKFLKNKEITYFNPAIYCQSEILAKSLQSYKKGYACIQTE
ncbi:hypothetical protein DCPSUM001_30860 [Dysgonomonas capnocytophagoides]|nr:hypothetical protein DCPSUM001_30860 [Dysgonomonas capnocytophagoides]